ncbi:UDP-3-O-[3-hydroxymyristoyl] N-acetylglucosamine deacetylase [Vibrio cholerae]|nr:UDP-3-O-[3-hydroxymyristoyl] N-acetylglucosamine deacetylase [Vibrio cholerae]
MLDDYRILNEEGLRFDNEFVTHKVLDAIGDLYMAGHAIVGVKRYSVSVTCSIVFLICFR